MGLKERDQERFFGVDRYFSWGYLVLGVGLFRNVGGGVYGWEYNIE